ncbi:protein transport protein SEC24 B [Spinacia oleracea]|uniref:Protein transport protein Sec24-like CEF n=1 Tax=Spinacia oleracea TaxID=3562 RepID=A0A9R0J6B9_SPIOL|nr:protein transport protein SEC24 B-like [Spinacia oleracea]XP_021860735.1 protein transport protein SEC24 B-like [Spinacia oleracea]
MCFSVRHSFTTVYGQRRIRVMNLSLSCTSTLPSIFHSADLDAQFICFLKQGACCGLQAWCTGVAAASGVILLHYCFCTDVLCPAAAWVLQLFRVVLLRSVSLRNFYVVAVSFCWLCNFSVWDASCNLSVCFFGLDIYYVY